MNGQVFNIFEAQATSRFLEEQIMVLYETHNTPIPIIAERLCTSIDTVEYVLKTNSRKYRVNGGLKEAVDAEIDPVRVIRVLNSILENEELNANARVKAGMLLLDERLQRRGKEGQGGKQVNNTLVIINQKLDEIKRLRDDYLKEAGVQDEQSEPETAIDS